MAPIVEDVADKFCDYLSKYADTGKQLEGKEIMVDYSLECIVSCGFGLEANCFDNPNSALRKMVNLATGKGANQTLRMMKLMFVLSFPKLGRALGVEPFSKKPLVFFADILQQAIKQRDETGERRNDLVDVFRDALKKGPKQVDTNVAEEDQFEKDAQLKSNGHDKTMSQEQFEQILISNAVILLFAGFDTTSTTLTITLAFLAMHQDLQVRIYALPRGCASLFHCHLGLF
jgi:cytochrome P450